MELEGKDFKVFDLFGRQWALAAAGTPERFNACTIGWGSLGSIWGVPGSAKSVVTVYIYPTRYTWEFMRSCELFTVSFFPPAYKKALSYMGSHSGRDGDKTAAAGLTPLGVGGSVGFAEAELTLVCRKLYEAPFDPAGFSAEIREGFYADREPHWVFIGEIVDAEDRRG